MALIEIDGLPNLKMGGSFHGYVSHNQMVPQKYSALNMVSPSTKRKIAGFEMGCQMSLDYMEYSPAIQLTKLLKMAHTEMIYCICSNCYFPWLC